MYVVKAMAPELDQRIKQTNPFDYTFGLSQLLGDEWTQKTFANLLLRAVVKR